MTKLEDKIKKSIKDRKPKSQGYFLFQNTAYEIVIGILWLLCVGILGALIYLMQNFPWRVFILPNFFLRGVAGLPWELMIFSSLLIVALYFLTKNISTFYRNKNILIVALVISLFAGYIVAEATGLNGIIAETKPVKPIYRCHGHLVTSERFPAAVGEITSIAENRIELEDRCVGEWIVIIDSDTKISSPLEIGLKIMVLGEKNNNQINAIEIRSFVGGRGFENGKPLHRPSPMPMY